MGKSVFVSLILLAAIRVVAQTTVISGVTIEPLNGPRVENGFLVIQGNRIVSAGPIADTPKGATVIDGKGMIAYPGFIDAYRQSGAKIPDAPAGATPPQTNSVAPPTMWDKNRKGNRAELDLAKLLDAEALVKYSYENGLTLALVAAGGGSIRGRTAIAGISTDKPVIVPQWGMEFSFRAGGGPAPAGGGGTGYPGSLLGVISLLRQTLYDAQGYAGEPKDEVLEALKPAVTGLQRSIFYANTENEIHRAFRLADEFNLKLVIAGGRDTYKRANELIDRKVPVLYSTSIGEEPARTGNGDPPDQVRAERADLWQERADGAKKLAAAGVQFAFSSDGDGVDGYLKNARNLIKRGLDKQVALKAMTQTPAEIFGLADYGTIAAGKVANLAIFDGDFADEKSKVTLVVVNGKVVDLRKKEGK